MKEKNDSKRRFLGQVLLRFGQDARRGRKSRGGSIWRSRRFSRSPSAAKARLKHAGSVRTCQARAANGSLGETSEANELKNL